MLFTGAKVFIGEKFENAEIRVRDGLVSEIAIFPERLAAGSAEEVMDCSGLKIIPGLFDIHTHGCLGYDFSKSSAAEDLKMLEFYAAHGVTSVLATTMTNELGQYRYACGEIRKLIGLQETSDTAVIRDSNAGSADGYKSGIDADESASGIPRAIIRGINMEGPFLSREKRGAHDPQYLYPVSEELFEDLNSCSGHNIRLLTIAPELDGAMDFIRRHSAVRTIGSDVTDSTPTFYHQHQYISLGHSACDYSTAVEAFNSGADHVTHLYNTMNGLSHRAPGIPGAAADSRAYVELICDGLHVHEAVVRHTFRANPGRVVLISDSINPTGLPEGSYSAGGLDVFMKNGEIRLADGTLAGSSITLFEGLRRCITRFDIPEEEAILAATLNPAASVGLAQECGKIAVGMPADLLAVDNAYGLKEVFLKGKKLPRFF